MGSAMFPRHITPNHFITLSKECYSTLIHTILYPYLSIFPKEKGYFYTYI